MKTICSLSLFCCFLAIAPAGMEAKTDLSTSGEDYILEIYTIRRGEWAFQRAATANREIEFTVPGTKTDDISCTFTPAEEGSIEKMIPSGKAVVLGEISCPGYNLSDFRKKTQLTKARYVESSAYSPTYMQHIRNVGWATHLIYKENIRSSFGSIQVLLRLKSKASKRENMDPKKTMEDLILEEREKRKDSMQEEQKKSLTPDRRGKIERLHGKEFPTPEYNNVFKDRRRQRTNTCTQYSGESYNKCIKLLRTPKASFEDPSAAAPKEERKPRRVQALEKRQARRISPLYDKIQDGAINLEPVTRQMQRKAQQVHRVQEGNQLPKGTSEGQKRIIRRRANPVKDRLQGASPVLCRRRNGLSLIRCLEEYGIEITPTTVDKYTWEIYEKRKGD